jgi:hypothetical protein
MSPAKVREELYAILIKGEQRGGLTIHDVYYMVGNPVPSHKGGTTLIEKMAMAITKDRIFVYYDDGSRMTVGYSPLKIDLFYRPIEKKKEKDDKVQN